MKQLFWDRIGISLSGICVVHCLLLPVVLALLPMWALGETFHAWLHPVFAAVLVPTTAVAAVGGFRRHRSWPVVALLLVGLCAIVAAGFLGHEQPGAQLETAITVTGSALLIGGHLRNWRLGARVCPTPTVLSKAA